MSEKGIRDRHAPERRSVDRYTRLVAQYQHQSLQARRSSTGNSNFLIANPSNFLFIYDTAVLDNSEEARFTDDGAPELVTTSEGEREIELRAERLVINKQRRQTGEARIRKQIVTEVRTIDVPVSHEELVIERQAVTGETDVDGEPIADETVRIPLSEEQVIIAKETVVSEEVEIGKRHVDDVEHIDDTVRHEELVVIDGATTT